MTSALPGITPVPVNQTTTPDKLLKANSVLDQIMDRMTTANEVKYLKTLIYCRPGIGKTSFCATPYDIGLNPVIYDIDGTTVTLAKHSKWATTIPVLNYKSEFQLEKIMEELIKGNLQQRILEERNYDMKVFCIDSLTQFQTNSLKTQLRAQLGVTSDTETLLTRYLTTDMNWPANTQYMEDVITRIAKIDMHVIVTCHVKMEKDTSSGLEAYRTRPDLTTKVYQALNRWANVIGYLEKDGEDRRTLRISPTKLIDAKSHIGGPPVLTNPTFQSLLNLKDGKPA